MNCVISFGVMSGMLGGNPNVSEQTIRALAGHASKQMLERSAKFGGKPSKKLSQLLSTAAWKT
jgi:hypothetical protein